MIKNNSTKYKFFDLFCIRIVKLLLSIALNNYINFAWDNWDNYLMVNNSNGRSKENNDPIDKNSNC